MTLPLRRQLSADKARAAALGLASKLRKLRVAEVLEDMTLAEYPSAVARAGTGSHGRLYQLDLKFFAQSRFPEEAALGWEEVEEAFMRGFMPRLSAALKKELRRLAADKSIVTKVHDLSGSAGGDEGERRAARHAFPTPPATVRPLARRTHLYKAPQSRTIHPYGCGVFSRC